MTGGEGGERVSPRKEPHFSNERKEKMNTETATLIVNDSERYFFSSSLFTISRSLFLFMRFLICRRAAKETSTPPRNHKKGRTREKEAEEQFYGT